MNANTAIDRSASEYKTLSTPDLYRIRDELVTDRSKTSEPEYKQHIKHQMARIDRVLRDRGLPTHSEDYRAGAHLWTTNLDELETIKVFYGYQKDPFQAIYKPLCKWQLVEGIKALDLLPGHTYRVCLVYRNTNVGNHRQFVKIEAIDKLALTGPSSGSSIRLGELEL